MPEIHEVSHHLGNIEGKLDLLLQRDEAREKRLLTLERGHTELQTRAGVVGTLAGAVTSLAVAFLPGWFHK